MQEGGLSLSARSQMVQKVLPSTVFAMWKGHILRRTPPVEPALMTGIPAGAAGDEESGHRKARFPPATQGAAGHRSGNLAGAACSLPVAALPPGRQGLACQRAYGGYEFLDETGGGEQGENVVAGMI